MKLPIGDIPQELLVRPSALVAFTGLHVNNNPVHKAIWESFSTNRHSDRAPLEYKLLEETHQFPNIKQKRTSYEWYVPKGLLKSNWLNKHLNEVPALYVLYVDLDWDHPQWNEAMQQCAQRVKDLRSRLFGRSTRVALVLIQKNTSCLPGEDILAAKNAPALCSFCDLSAKSLFVLPQSDHLAGYITRLEIAFNELAKGYYNHEVRVVKSHQEFLSKTTHQLLFVRHQFKIGFLSELKQDFITGLKHYKQAYNNLMEVRVADTNLLEVKTVAGFINYKICQLSFLNTPLEAISQFRKHIDTFKNNMGSKDLIFEHHSWMSKQYEFFGDLFDNAIKQGLGAIQTQHPGFYYQQAAHHASVRKETCQNLCKVLKEYPVNDPLANQQSLDFYGQRPWRPGNQNMEPPDPQREKDGILALQHQEINTINHSKLIIPLLNNAVNQFKKYRCPRMKRHLMVLMGEEYYQNQEYNRALILLTKVASDYRAERWWTLLTNIFRTALKCAYLSGNVQEYVTLSMEMIGKYSECTREAKARIHANMNRVFTNAVPDPELDCLPKSIEKASKLWEQIMKSKSQLFTLEVSNMIAFVDCKAKFARTSFHADEIVTVQVYIQTICPLPVEFSKLSVFFSNKMYNDHCVLTNENNSLRIIPNEPKCFEFSFIPQENDVDHDIQITSVTLQLGAEPSHTVVLYWTSGDNNSMLNASFTNSIEKFDSSNFSSIVVLSNTRICKRQPKLSFNVRHQPPALQNEFYPIKIDMKNNEEDIIKEVQLHFKLTSDSSENASNLNTHISVDEPNFFGEIKSSVDKIAINNLESGQSVAKIFYVKFLSNCAPEFEIEVSYNVEVKVQDQTLSCKCAKVEGFSLQIVDPFYFSVKTLDTKFSELKRASSEEPFVIIPDIKCISPWPVLIETSHLGLSKDFNTVGETVTSQLQDLTLKTDDIASECICVVGSQADSDSLPLGHYTLQWKRIDCDENVPFVQTTFDLPSLSVKASSLYVEANIPASGLLRTCLPISYTIHNRMSEVVEVEVMMDSSEAFMFSGHKQYNCIILPRGHEQLHFNLYPLTCGYVLLPRMRIKLNPKSELPVIMDQEVQRVIPSQVFIMPKGKPSEASSEYQQVILSQ